MIRARSHRRRGRARARRSVLARWIAALGLTLLIALSGAGALWFWAERSGPAGEPLHVTFPDGAGIRDAARALQAQGALGDARLFVLYAWLRPGSEVVASGPHLLRRGLAPAELLARLTRSRARPIVKVTIPEGYDRFQIADRLEAREVIARDVFLDASESPAVLTALGVPADTAEGYLFPATYDLYVDSDASKVVGMLVSEALRRFRAIAARHPTKLEELAGTLGWGLPEVVTLASIVEKEAADSSEHGTIASVFYNRLRDPSFLPRRMLQSDPTAAYGCLVARATIPSCRDFDGSISPLMLRDAANPYNTYKHPGLPPGPIANPGESAFEAAIAPPDTPFFFFVAGRSKRHVFSRTLSEHQHAIATE